MTRRLPWTAPAAIAAAIALALSAPAAFAQQSQPANPPQQAPTQAAAAAGQPDAGPAPTDAELKHFAQAAVEVQGIRQSLEPGLAAAKTAGDRTALKKTAEKKMETAVRDNQLTLQRYVQIANVVQKDPALRTKVQNLMPPAPQPQS